MSTFVLGAGGFRRLSRNLKKADAEAPKKLKEINKQTADIVVEAGKGKAASIGGVARKASRGLRASKAASAVQVLLGGARYPYAVGAELGAKKYKQFKTYKGFPSDPFAGQGGYFVFPAVRDNKERIQVSWVKGVDELLRETFPEQL